MFDMDALADELRHAYFEGRTRLPLDDWADLDDSYKARWLRLAQTAYDRLITTSVSEGDIEIVDPEAGP